MTKDKDVSVEFQELPTEDAMLLFINTGHGKYRDIVDHVMNWLQKLKNADKKSLIIRPKIKLPMRHLDNLRIHLAKTVKRSKFAKSVKVAKNTRQNVIGILKGSEI